MLANQSDIEEEPMQIVGLGDDTLPDKTWEDIEAGAPSELSIMKEVGSIMPELRKELHLFPHYILV